ncbi:hypothetical protein HDU93_004169 [Gonapodya sp. JEL0774]|nr:hypothetical protein HDU93_004169 [Gonapodya sp. JEL0774]
MERDLMATTPHRDSVTHNTSLRDCRCPRHSFTPDQIAEIVGLDVEVLPDLCVRVQRACRLALPYRLTNLPPEVLDQVLAILSRPADFEVPLQLQLQPSQPDVEMQPPSPEPEVLILPPAADVQPAVVPPPVEAEVQPPPPQPDVHPDPLQTEAQPVPPQPEAPQFAPVAPFQAKRFESKQPLAENPAPGTYNLPTSTLLNDDPAKHYGFLGKSKRFNEQKDESSGADGEGRTDKENISAAALSAFNRRSLIGTKERDEVAKYRKEITQLTAHLARLESAAAAATSKRTSLESDVAAKEKEVGQLKDTVAGLRSALEKSERLSISLQEKLTRNSNLAKRVEDLDRKNLQLKQLLTRTEQDRDDARAKVGAEEDVRKQKDKFAEEKKKVVAEAERDKARAAAAEKEKQAAEARLQKAEEELVKAKEALKALTEAHAVDAREARQAAEATEARLNATVLSLRREVDEAIARAHQVQQDAAESARNAEAQLADRDTKLREAEARAAFEIEELESNLRDAAARSSKLEREIIAIRSARDAAETEWRAARGELERSLIDVRRRLAEAEAGAARTLERAKAEATAAAELIVDGQAREANLQRSLADATSVGVKLTEQVEEMKGRFAMLEEDMKKQKDDWKREVDLLQLSSAKGVSELRDIIVSLEEDLERERAARFESESVANAESIRLKGEVRSREVEIVALKESRTRMEEEMRRAVADLERLLSDGERDAAGREQELCADIRRLTEVVEELESKLETRQKDLEALEALRHQEKAGYQEELVWAKEQSSRATAERDAEIAALKSKIEVTSNGAEAEISAKNSEILSLQDMLTAIKLDAASTAAAHTRQIDLLETEIAKIRSESIVAIERREEAISALRMEMDSRVAHLDGVVAGKVQEIAHLLDARNALRAEMEDRIAAMEDEVAELTRQSAEAHRVSTVAQQEADARIADLSNSLAVLEARLSDVRGDLAQETDANVNLRNKISALERELASTARESSAQIFDLTGQLRDAHSQLQCTKGDLDSERAHNISLRSEVSDLSRQTQSLEASLQQEKRERENLQVEISALRRKHDHAARSLANLRDSSDLEIAGLKSEVDGLVRRMDKERVANEEMMTSMRTDHHSLSLAHAEVCQQRDNLSRESETLAKQLSISSADKADLWSQLMDARSTYPYFSSQCNAIDLMEQIAQMDIAARERAEDLAKTLEQELVEAMELLGELRRSVVNAHEETTVWKMNYEAERERNRFGEQMVESVSKERARLVDMTDSSIHESATVVGDLKASIAYADAVVADIVCGASVAQVSVFFKFACLPAIQLSTILSKVKYAESLVEEQVASAKRLVDSAEGRRAELETLIVQERFAHNQEMTRSWEQLQKSERDFQQLMTEYSSMEQDLRANKDALANTNALLQNAQKEMEAASHFQEENTKLRQRIEQNAAAVMDAERKSNAANATLRMAEQLEEQNADLHAAIEILSTQIRELEEQKMELEETMRDQLELIMKKHNLADQELKQVTEINAHLLGHQNTRQKIKYVDQIKKENLKYKQEHVDLTSKLQKCRIRIMKLERDLEAVRAVSVPLGMSTEGDSSAAAPRPRSRVGRAVLAAREETPQPLRSKSAGARPGDRNFTLFGNRAGDDDN